MAHVKTSRYDKLGSLLIENIIEVPLPILSSEVNSFLRNEEIMGERKAWDLVFDLKFTVK